MIKFLIGRHFLTKNNLQFDLIYFTLFLIF